MGMNFDGTLKRENPDLTYYANNKEQVNHPEHYQTKNGIECIDAVAAATEDLKGEEAFCIGSAIKYLWRYRKKLHPKEDLKKAVWYIEKIINKMEEMV